MKTRLMMATCATLVLVLITGCSPSAPPQESSSAQGETFTPAASAPTLVPTEAPTSTPGAFVLDLQPHPTSTALPTLVLPPRPAFSPGAQVWDGLPTYPADSREGFYFRLLYYPAEWALTTNQYGFPALASRGLPGCVIAPAVGRGLPPNGSVDHDTRMIGEVSYQISSISVGGALQTVVYAGGNGVIFTAFEVSFVEAAEPCVAAAEAVLGTLRAVPLSEATPVPPA